MHKWSTQERNGCHNKDSATQEIKSSTKSIHSKINQHEDKISVIECKFVARDHEKQDFLKIAKDHKK